MLIDRLADVYGIRLAPSGFSCRGEGRIASAEVVLARPMTFMNVSGIAVSELRSDLSLPLESIVVAHDDCDLPLGRIRIRRDGGSGGHRGIESIADSLGSTDFARIRLGVGRPSGGGLRDYVLEPFDLEEGEEVEEMLSRASAAVEAMTGEGLERAMNAFNPPL